VLAVYRGTLDLHGKPHSVTWTRLSEPANAGSQRICLLRKVDWPVNADIVIASTDYVKEHAETRVITGVTSNGYCLTVDVPLEFEHAGIGCELELLFVSVFHDQSYL
jgi:hypothetical protein